ncbi:MAG: zinc ribbon domain-containing protein, partial [Gammaproteobacteria bacterium]|nr:zinc ribbon domain-containing protein [Gammaproteobacteria bacterium]
EANRKAERFACRACGHRDHADCNAARNILGLGLNKLLAGGAPVTGRGGDNETGVLLCEWRHLVETANDPSRHLPWNLPRLDPG